MEKIEIGAKVQYLYERVRENHERVMRGKECEEGDKEYEYLMLCELMMDYMKEEFPFVVDGGVSMARKSSW